MNCDRGYGLVKTGEAGDCVQKLNRLVRFSRVATNGIQLHVAQAGPVEGKPLFLLHGFPEFWYGWRNQIVPLAERGFHVIVPDQRGYNLSDKPGNVSSYDLDHLASDVVGLADHFGLDTFSVVGHDWGASVGWWLAEQHPDRLRRMVALNAPHPAVWRDAMRHEPAQKRKSGYVRHFQIPYLPELLEGLDRFRALSAGVRDRILPDGFTQADLDQYRKAWSEPGAVTAMIHHYRALWEKKFMAPREHRVTTPVLVIWGDRDCYAVPELAIASVGLCTDARLVRLPESTHWSLHDEPERVLNLLTNFLTSR